MQIFVEFLNSEGGEEEIPSRCKRVSQLIEHLQRKYPGQYPGLRLKYYDQELKDDQLLKDLLEENQSILELGALEKMTEDADKLRACLTTYCRIVFKQKGNKTPQFLYPNDAPFEFKSSFFRRNESFVVFKDAEEREDGEQVWIGYRYVLQVDANLLDVKVKNEGVFKHTRDHVWSKMEPVGEPVRALEGDFFMPVSDHTWFGQPLSVFIKNKTGNKILAISGGSKRFKKLDLDPISGDDRAQHIKIRKVNRGYALGLTTEQHLDGNRNKVYVTDMYMIPGGGRIKLIEIETTARQGYRVTLIKANDERLNPLQKFETKTFREADKDFWRNTLTKGLIALGSAVVAGAVGEGVEEAVGEIFGTGNAGEVSMDSGDVSTDNGDVLMDTGDGCDDSLEIGADRDDQQGMPAPVPDGQDDPINDCNENL